MVTAENKKLLTIANSLCIEVIYDCGSRDAKDGLFLLNNIKSSKELHIFEPNPVAIEICKENIAKDNSKKIIKLNEIALSDKVGTIKFFPINPEKTITPHEDGNIGASSIFRAKKDYPAETYVQDEIEVKTINFDTYILTNKCADLLWVDLQGAELLAFKGGVRMLSAVKLIYVEVTFIEMYENQAMFGDVHKFLNKNGFELIELEGTSKLKKLFYTRFSSIFNFLKIGPWFTNAIYIKKNLVLKK